MNILKILLGFFVGHRGGLLPHQDDERDFQFSALGGIFGGYTPKHRVYELPTVSVKNQGSLNTCVWNSATVQKETEEATNLSVRFLVTMGRKMGYAGWSGYAQLRDAQKLLVGTGICEESLCPDEKTQWQTYSDPSRLTYDMNVAAQKHKSKSFFAVSSKDDYLKAIDDGYIVHTGCEWFTGYNSANLPSPYIIKPRTGISVGGHAFVCKGYDLDKGLLKFQNSYGPSWGDNGCFYVKMSDWFGGMGFTGYVTVDVDQQTLWSMYEGKDVKGSGPAIFRIERGKKRVFPNEQAFFKNGGKFNPRTWVQISDSLLNSIPQGDQMV